MIITERAGHAYDVVSTLPERELRSLDGIVTVVHTFMLSVIIWLKEVTIRQALYNGCLIVLYFMFDDK